MVIKKTQTVGWWRMEGEVNGVYFNVTGPNKIKLIDEMFKKIRWYFA